MKMFSILLFTLLISCSKRTTCLNGTQGKLKNKTGLDGCGWVIESNGKVYEPLNLNDFDHSLLVENNKIVFSYETTQMGSICMVGETILLNCIVEK